MRLVRSALTLRRILKSKVKCNSNDVDAAHAPQAPLSMLFTWADLRSPQLESDKCRPPAHTKLQVLLCGGKQALRMCPLRLTDYSAHAGFGNS